MFSDFNARTRAFFSIYNICYYYYDKFVLIKDIYMYFSLNFNYTFKYFFYLTLIKCTY